MMNAKTLMVLTRYQYVVMLEIKREIQEMVNG
jgi:hypothetical protein